MIRFQKTNQDVGDTYKSKVAGIAGGDSNAG